MVKQYAVLLKVLYREEHIIEASSKREAVELAKYMVTINPENINNITHLVRELR